MARHKTLGYTPARGHRGLAISASAAAAIVLALGGYLLGRATTDGAATPAVPDTSAVAGIPIPDRRTEAGAATAAQNFQIAGYLVSSGTLLSANAVATLLSLNADDSARQVLTDGQPADARTSYAPLSAVVLSSTADRAEVQVWGVATTSSLTGSQPTGTQIWGRSTVTLAWEGEQWRVLSQRYEPGPWPVRADARLAEAEGDFTFRSRELIHTGWSYVPEP